MFNNMYQQQMSVDRINNQIAELEKLKSQIPQHQMQQPTNLTQNFQLAPSNNAVMKYANSIDEVQKEFVVGDTPYFSRDLSILWIKSPKGEIKSYELTEIIPKDEKDLQIELLKSEIDELKGMIKSEQHITNVIQPKDEADTKGNDESVGTTTKKNKSTSVSRISTSKKEQ